MPSHRREYGAGTALQLHTLLPFAANKVPSCSRPARRAAVAPPLPAPHQRTMALLYPQISSHDISASMESACFQVSQYGTQLQQGTQSLQQNHHETQFSARGGGYAAGDHNCRLSSAAALDLQHVEPQHQRLASSDSRSRSISGVVAGASTEQMDIDMDALDMSLQLQLGDFPEWWTPIAPSEEVVSSNNHAALISSTDIVPQGQQRGREEQEKTQNNSADFVTAQAIKEQESFGLESWCAARSSIAGVQNLLSIDDDNNNDAPPKATCNKKSHVPSSRDQSCCHLPAAATVEPMTPTIESGRGSHNKGSGRIISPCAVRNPREGISKTGAIGAEKANLVATSAVHKKPWGSSVKRAVSQRESHIWSERQRRKGMNHLFSTLRSLLPQPSSKTDKSTVVSEIIKYIQSLQVKLDILTKKRKQMLEARALSQTTVVNLHPMEPPKTSPAGGAAAVTPENLAISMLDDQGNAHHGNHESSIPYVQQHQQQADLAAMSANLNHVPQQQIIQQSDSCLQSFLGANVGLHICGSNAFITISSPRGQRGIFHRILVTVQNQHLDVVNAFISTSKASIFHCLHCQDLQGSDLSKEELHTALQMVITNYGKPI